MARVGALVIAFLLAVPLSIAIEKAIAAPSSVGSGLAACLGLGVYAVIRPKLSRWLEQGTHAPNGS